MARSREHGGRIRFGRLVLAGTLLSAGLLGLMAAAPSPASAVTVTDYTGPGIDQPATITVGPDGALWFTNQLGNSIGRITTSGTVTNFTSSLIDEPYGITSGPDGALWFTNQGNNTIGRITTSGQVSSFSGTGIDEPFQITAGPDGALWFTNFRTIGRITTSGTVTTYDGSDIDYPYGITAGPDGALWFTNSDGNSIGRITTSGVVSTFSGTGIAEPLDITTGPDGALWFTNAGDNSIGSVTTSGSVSNYTDRSIDGPEGITTGSDGALWFTNSDSSTIGRISTSGVVSYYPDPTFTNPSSIVSGPDDALWFTNLGNNTIGRITTDGALPTEVLAFGNQSGTKLGPFGIFTYGTGTSATGSFTSNQAGWPKADTTSTLRTADVTCVEFSGNTATITGTVTAGKKTETVVAQGVGGGTDELRFSYAPYITQVSPGCDSPVDAPVRISSGVIDVGPPLGLSNDQVLAYGNQNGSASGFFGLDTQGTGTSATGFFSDYQSNWPNAKSSTAVLRTADVTCVEVASGTATITGTVTSGTHSETVVAQADVSDQTLRFSYAPNITQVSPGCDSPVEQPVAISSGDIEIGS